MSALPEPPISDRYETDFYAWTHEQAALLRWLRAASASLPAGIDLDQIAEELEDMGRSDLRSARKLVFQILVHVLKISSAPEIASVNHWYSEINGFLVQLVDDAYAPSMRQRIDMQAVWTSACDQALIELEERGGRLLDGLPMTCPFSLDDLLERRRDIARLVAKARSSAE